MSMEPVVLTPVFFDKVGKVYQPINDATETDLYVITEADYQRLLAAAGDAKYADRYLWLDERAPVITAKPEDDYCVWSITFHSPYGLLADEYDLDEAIDAAIAADEARR